jgi:hypothetical protein
MSAKCGLEPKISDCGNFFSQVIGIICREHFCVKTASSAQWCFGAQVFVVSAIDNNLARYSECCGCVHFVQSPLAP